MFRRFLTWFFGLFGLHYPPHTVESVAREIIEGLENGTVVLPPGFDDEPDAPKPEVPT